MNTILLVGIIIGAGFLFGELANKVKLPKVTGYILAGVVLNPKMVGFIPGSFVSDTDLVTNLSLSVIAFSVGGTLLLSKIRKLGRRILSITLLESTMAFSLVLVGFILITPFFLDVGQAGYMTVYVPFALLLSALAAPTDPTATLAVAHEYNAKGDVMSSVMGVAAFDDAIGIVLYSVAVAFAGSFIAPEGLAFGQVTCHIVRQIFGALLVGGVLGWIFNQVTKLVKREGEGMFIVMIIGVLAMNFGISRLLKVDELLSVMFMGFVVVNFNISSEKIFTILERYTEQLIFVLFFTISGMHLDIFVLGDYYFLILFYVILRALGKFLGVNLGARRSVRKVRKYTAGGLIPQGGIVIGLALLIKQDPAFSQISDEFINIILGATVIHELIGPVLAKFSLRKAGEIEKQ